MTSFNRILPTRGRTTRRRAAVVLALGLSGLAFAGVGTANASVHTSSTSPVLLDAVSVFAGGRSTTSHVSLQSGVKYTIRISGTLSLSHTGTIGDAEYGVLSDGTLQDVCASSPHTDLGVGINSPGATSQKTPVAWGAYSSHHVYSTGWVGAGAPVTFNYHDCNSSDNSGHVVARIYKSA
jgi:hypothetical protein